MKRILYLLLILSLASCRSVEYVTVPEVHTELVRDTVFSHDTIERFSAVYTKGDTVFRHDSVRVKVVQREYHDREIRDTIIDTYRIRQLEADLSALNELLVQSEKQSHVRGRVILDLVILLLVFATPTIIKTIKKIRHVS